MELPSSDQPAAAGGAFVREGEYWAIVYEGTVLRLRDCKGLRYLARLLRQPGAGVAAMELANSDDLGVAVDPERARSAVTKRIRDAVHKIGRHHPSLGYHLSTAVKTGHTCVYLPDPTPPMAWRMRRRNSEWRTRGESREQTQR